MVGPANFSESTGKKAKKLGVVSVKQKFSGGWWWATPDQAREIARNA